MYLKFFGLTERPFDLTPDPKFLFLTPGHREALAQLIYGIQEEKGFILMTGEIGTGKTTLLRTLLERVDGKVDAAFITNSTLPFEEILEYAFADLGVTHPGGTRAQRLIALHKFLIEQRRAKRSTVLIIDEAQNLSIETLEQIRLLSNFETTSDKLVQIILSGQPELHDKLQLPVLRQLKQRIGLRCTLQPMTEEQLAQYIVSHLRVAGGRQQPFTDAAVRRIAQYSGGVPRIVNVLCDHCLLSAYADQQQAVDVAVVNRAIQYLEDDGARRRAAGGRALAFRKYPRRVVMASAGAVAAAAVISGVVSSSIYATAVHAVSTTMGGSLSGVVRWLTHWWGS